jgi:hypothetical protein
MFFTRHGITVEQLLTDNGSGYRSTIHAIACRTLGIRHLRTRAYRPQTKRISGRQTSVGAMPRSYQVTPVILGRRRATEPKQVRPNGRLANRESARRRPKPNQPAGRTEPPEETISLRLRAEATRLRLVGSPRVDLEDQPPLPIVGVPTVVPIVDPPVSLALCRSCSRATLHSLARLRDWTLSPPVWAVLRFLSTHSSA